MSGKGDSVRSGLNRDKYRSEHDRIFGKPDKKKENNEHRSNKTTRPKQG